MRVVDTSAWIEWLLGSTAGELVDKQLPAVEDWVVPTIVQFELAKWARREGSPGRTTEGVIAFAKDFVIADLTTEMAIRAAGVSRLHGLAAADAIIYATALENGADLLTCDAHFEDLPGVVYIENRRH